MIKSPASRKRFFIVKGEKGTMNEKELKEKLREQKLDDNEIKFILSNEKLKNILMSETNEKKALDVLKDGISESIEKIKIALELDNISDMTNGLIEPLTVVWVDIGAIQQIE